MQHLLAIHMQRLLESLVERQEVCFSPEYIKRGKRFYMNEVSFSEGRFFGTPQR